MSQRRVLQWRGFDGQSLEVLRLEISADGVRAHSDLVRTGPNPFAVSYEWLLDASWRTRVLHIRVKDAEPKEMSIERTGESRWRIHSRERSDVSGCEEIDLAITPFCNTLALRLFGPPPGAAGELTALYIGFPDLLPVPSRQRYEQTGPSEFLYVDLGVHSGFRAKLTVDADGLVRSYENLFERVEG